MDSSTLNHNSKPSINNSDLIEDELISRGISVINSKVLDTANSRGIAFKFSNGKKFVVLNDNLINGEKERHLVIAHEREHFNHESTFYSLDECPFEKQRKESLVSKSLFRTLIDEEELFKLAVVEHKQLEDLSDYFDLPIETICKALEYYSEFNSWNILKLKYHDALINLESE